jgi:mono/diheme cytochrome c family protein
MSRWLRRLGLTAGGLLTLLALFVAVAWGLTERRFRRQWTVEPRQIALSTDSATIARGRHVATAISKCAGCHGDDFGGRVLIDEPMMGRLFSANLTRGRGGVGAEYTDADWVRAIRHGADRNGHGLLIMPSIEYAAMSDADLGAVVSYLKSVPPVDREKPSRRINLLPRVLMTVGVFPPMGVEAIAHDKAGGEAPPAGVTVEYGRYLATIGGCTSCHGPALSGGGGGEPGSPPASNITRGGIGDWTEADFFTALRTGKRKNGTAINEAMPWRNSGMMTDDEIKAVWAFLRSVPAKEFAQK